MPLAVALLNVSNPNVAALDTLSRLSHDADTEVAQCAVLSLGGLLLPPPPLNSCLIVTWSVWAQLLMPQAWLSCCQLCQPS